MNNRKMNRSFQDFLPEIRHATYIHKRDWVRTYVKGKDVLDLGAVQHNLKNYTDQDRWLHGIIKKEAASVLGVDILEDEVKRLRELGENIIVGDAETLRLNKKFDVVVCGDLIEHVTNVGGLLETITFHLSDLGMALISTPNPFAISRFFNILFDGWTGINTEHVCWICPQTMFQLVERCGLIINEFYWLETDYPMPTHLRIIGPILNIAATKLASTKQVFRNDYGVVLRKNLH